MESFITFSSRLLVDFLDGIEKFAASEGSYFSLEHANKDYAYCQ